jgi:hypothetical protein
MKHILIISLIAILSISCGNTKEASANNNNSVNNEDASAGFTNIKSEDYQEDSLLVRIELSACFGNCPVERFSIFADGSFTYSGINFVDHVGDYTGTIKKKEVNEIYTMMTKLHIAEYPEKFGYGVSDISTKAIIFNYEKKRKKIIFKQYGDYAELKGFISRVRGIMAGAKYKGIAKD